MTNKRKLQQLRKQYLDESGMEECLMDCWSKGDVKLIKHYIKDAFEHGVEIGYQEAALAYQRDMRSSKP